MTNEDKKTLVKRQPTVTKTYRPPYTSLRQPETEKITSVEEPYKKWQQGQYSNLDEYIKAELKSKGITKEMLQTNPILRRQVTDWKRELYSGTKVTLDTALQEDREYQKQIESITGTDKFTFAEIEAQNKKFKESYEAGEITDKEYNMAITQQNANIIAEQKQTMREADFTGTWNEFVKYLEEKERAVNSALSSGLIKQDGDNITINKSPDKWTEADVKTYNELGFNVSKPIAKFSPKEISEQNETFKEALNTGKITEKQYNQATQQQKLNLQATYKKYDDEGLINEIQLEDGSTVYIIEKNYWEYSPSEQEKLKGMFNITPKFQLQADLISSGAIKQVGNNLVQNKPYLELNEKQVEDMSSLGFEMPSWTVISKYKGLKKDVPGQIAGGIITTTNQIAKDVVDSLNWITKDADIFNLIPDTDIKFEGPTLANIDQWVRIDDPSYKVVANVAFGIAEGFALDLLFTAGIGVVAKAAGTVGRFTVSKTGISKVASYLANSEKYTNIVSKIPSFTYGKTTATNIAKWLTIHPNITGLIISAPVAGINIGVALEQLKAGADPYDVASQLGKNFGMIAGGLLYNKVYTDAQRKVVNDLVRKRIIDIDGVHTGEGFSLEFTTELKNMPKKYAGIFDLQQDPITGKVILTGFKTSHGQRFPEMWTFTAEQWDDIWKSLSYGPDALKVTLLNNMEPEDYYLLTHKFPELAKMSTDDFFDAVSNYKTVATTQMSPDEISKVVSDFSRISRVSDENAMKIIFNNPELAKFIQGNMDDLAKVFDDIGMVPDNEVLRILQKEANERGYWLESMKGIDGKIVTGTREAYSFGFDDLQAFIVEDKRDILTEMYQKFLSYGFDKNKASRLASNILSDDFNTISEALATLKLTDTQKGVIMALRLEAGGPTQNVSHFYRAIKAFGVPDDEIPEVLNAFIKSQGSETYTIDRSMLTGAGKLSDEGLAAYTAMQQPEFITNFKKVPELLSRIIEIVPSSNASNFIGLLPTSAIIGLSTEALTNSIVGMETAQLTSFINKLSTENLSILVPKLDITLLNSIVPKLDSSQLPIIFVSLTPDQINAVVPSLTTDLFQGIIQALDIPLEVIQLYLQTGQLTSIRNVPPILVGKLLDEHIKRKKKELKKQKVTMFEVKLLYYASSERYKIKAKSFKEAVLLALQRRKNQQVPIGVIVRQIQSQKI